MRVDDGVFVFVGGKPLFFGGGEVAGGWGGHVYLRRSNLQPNLESLETPSG